jgi:hypothetical protein
MLLGMEAPFMSAGLESANGLFYTAIRQTADWAASQAMRNP